MSAIINEIQTLASGGPSANIDNHVFRAYYVFTSSFLLASSAVLISSQFFGDPIDCMASFDYVRADSAKKSIDTFCWVSATYTVDELYGKDNEGRGVKLDEGVGQFIPEFHTQRFQLYYRWVPLLLIIQALLCYIPHYLWRSWESGKMEGLSTMLSIPVEPTLDSDRRKARINLLLNYLESYDTNSHEYYTYRFYACEFANFLVLILNVWMINWMSDGLFWELGPDFLKNGQSSIQLAKFFPILANCLWKRVGPSGSTQRFDAVCVLPLNSFNKIVFVFLWFWYVVLAVVTIYWLIFRVTTRATFIKARHLRWKACSVNHPSHPHKDMDCIDNICKLFPNPDWFVLLQLVDNTDPVAIKDILKGLCERLSHKNRRMMRTPESKALLENHENEKRSSGNIP